MIAARRLSYYWELWQTCELLRTRQQLIERALARVRANEADYQAVQELTGVPWLLVGAMHYREADCDMRAGLHNGEPWNRATVGVPAGRGPFGSWIDSAHDAIIQARMQGHDAAYWSIPQQLAAAERYNGLGYARRGKNSPYVWNWTNHGIGAGYFVADGQYSPEAENKQAGVAAILKLAEMGDEV